MLVRRVGRGEDNMTMDDGWQMMTTMMTTQQSNNRRERREENGGGEGDEWWQRKQWQLRENMLGWGAVVAMWDYDQDDRQQQQMTWQTVPWLGKGQEEEEEEEVVAVEEGNHCTVCEEDVEEKEGGKWGSVKIIELIPTYFLQAPACTPLF
jgi:hypothetical protein